MATPRLEVASRRQLRAAVGEYRSALVPMIAEREVRLSRDARDGRRREQGLTRFDAEAGAFAALFAAILLRTESASSSEVEHLTASAKQVALAELDRSDSANAKLVVANVRAMQAAIALSDRLDEQAIIAMHEALLESSAPHFVGGWRDQQVWIGGGSFSPHHATFVPPHHDRVPSLMADLAAIRRPHRRAGPAHAAIAHAQFETIHVPHGSGRTGRALLHGMLRACRRHLERGCAGLGRPARGSRRLLPRAPGTGRGARRDRGGGRRRGAFRAVANGRALVRELQEIAASWDALVRARSDASVHRRQGACCSISSVTAASVAEAVWERGRGADLVDKLVAAGVLTRRRRTSRPWRPKSNGARLVSAARLAASG